MQDTYKPGQNLPKKLSQRGNNGLQRALLLHFYNKTINYITIKDLDRRNENFIKKNKRTEASIYNF